MHIYIRVARRGRLKCLGKQNQNQNQSGHSETALAALYNYRETDIHTYIHTCKCASVFVVTQPAAAFPSSVCFSPSFLCDTIVFSLSLSLSPPLRCSLNFSPRLAQAGSQQQQQQVFSISHWALQALLLSILFTMNFCLSPSVLGGRN